MKWKCIHVKNKEKRPRQKRRTKKTLFKIIEILPHLTHRLKNADNLALNLMEQFWVNLKIFIHFIENLRDSLITWSLDTFSSSNIHYERLQGLHFIILNNIVDGSTGSICDEIQKTKYFQPVHGVPWWKSVSWLRYLETPASSYFRTFIKNRRKLKPDRIPATVKLGPFMSIKSRLSNIYFLA